MSGEIEPPFDWAAPGDFINHDYANAAVQPDAVVGENAPQQADSSPAPYRDGLRKVGQVAAVALAALAIGEGLARIPGRDHHSTPVAAVACKDTPGPQALEAVTKLFAYNGVPQEYGPWVAKRYGLHLVPDTGQLGYNFKSSLYSSSEAEVASASESLNPYGFTIQLGLPSAEHAIEGLENPTPSEVKQDLNDALDDITEPLIDLPTEVTHLSGIREIVLMSGANSAPQIAFDGPHVLLWNINNDGTADLMGQALYEGIDHAECGYTSTSDPTYAHFNGRPPLSIYDPKVDQEFGLLSLTDFGDPQQGNYYSPDPESTLVYQNSEGKAAYNEGTQTGNYGKFCVLLRDDFESTVVATQAGFEGPEEDKIGIGGLMLDVDTGNSGFLFNVDSPDLRRRALFLAARLYKESPGIVNYLARAGVRSFSVYDPCSDVPDY